MRFKTTFIEAATDEIRLHWRLADDLTWNSPKSLYLFRKLNGREILYIGKASSQSMKQRVMCPSKGRLGRLAKKEKITIRPLITGFHTTRRITPHLIDDVERLLIYLVQPRWNITGKQTCSPHHRDLVLNCTGDWPFSRTRFIYQDDFPRLLLFQSE